jgi:NADPH:quinone reductase-like Zn-dependent oxidoreductase
VRSVAVFGGVGEAPGPAVEIDGMAVRSGIVELPDPAFDARDPAFARSVVVNVHAFSCNYRDKAFILRMERFPAGQFFTIGSELVGTVVEAGPGVTTLAPGDRVVNQNHYTGRGVDDEGVPEGLPTNHASREYQVFHERKLARIPDRMGDEVAAGFSIGAQTAYSMVRKLDPGPGARVLVPSAGSNTSLFAIAALRHRGVRVFAATTSPAFDERLMALGVERVVHLGGAEPAGEGEPLSALSREIGGFDCVVDPYFDLHLERSVALMAPGGRYTTCGLLGQNPEVARGAGIQPIDAQTVMLHVMAKNLSILGNCIGLASDLEAALADYRAGRLECVVDSVFGGGDTAPFLDRTFVDRRRLGKVVFRY